VEHFFGGDRRGGRSKADGCLRHRWSGAWAEVVRLFWHSHIMSVVGDVRVEGGEGMVLEYIVVVEVVREEGGLFEQGAPNDLVWCWIKGERVVREGRQLEFGVCIGQFRIKPCIYSKLLSGLWLDEVLPLYWRRRGRYLKDSGGCTSIQYCVPRVGMSGGCQKKTYVCSSVPRSFLL
jgi:hypothetical protein